MASYSGEKVQKASNRTAAKLLSCHIKQIEVAVKWNSETFQQVQGARLSSVPAAGGAASQSATGQEIHEVGACLAVFLR